MANHTICLVRYPSLNFPIQLLQFLIRHCLPILCFIDLARKVQNQQDMELSGSSPTPLCSASTSDDMAVLLLDARIESLRSLPNRQSSAPAKFSKPGELTI